MTPSPPLRLTAASLMIGTSASFMLDARPVGPIAGTLVTLTLSTGVTAPSLVILRVSSMHPLSHVRRVPSRWPLRRPLGLSRPLRFRRRSCRSFLLRCRLVLSRLCLVGQPPIVGPSDVPVTSGPPGGRPLPTSIFGSPPLVDLTSTPHGVPPAPSCPPLLLRASPWATRSLRGLSPSRVSILLRAESDRPPTSSDTFVPLPLPTPGFWVPPLSMFS